MSRQRPHPLFDASSLFGLASRNALENDEGQKSVVDYLASLKHAELKVQGREELGFRYPPAVQRAIRDALSGSESLADEEPEERAGPAPVGAPVGAVMRPVEGPLHAKERGFLRQPAADAFYTVAMLEAGQPLQWREPRPGRDVFVSREETTRRGARARASIELDRLPAFHRLLLMFLPPDLLQRLGRAVGRGPAGTTWDEVRPWLEQALDTELLVPREHSEEKRRLALEVASLWAQAPALAGSSDSNGRHRRSIRLPWSCPSLEKGTWLVALVGPAAPRR